ncbi:Glyoxalase/Bleomycin resistance protein/Dihydroxybiphenyl dioxygenase [Arabidopsis thaliana x Arabidopsis arenosa]|uniref:Glyoxalase/Bleomycin resistance protein/Dihydroxybiphenyl dioxygenase n=2 Tax=Arabidopsis TaxID=3701 RepID=A0A8T2DE37_9BRAS|nr:Glyoxalase/Bleomycin resistance protein/Dihydroxybiphenyl dioxygenase [Arabidopsis thaliana x Arabidopsis arenosa]OAO93321.1 hypothetical protein AXX17_AT5G47010 [Arabidopsis thaliana]CAD5334324.1 unnamed protein product [Arabidopsis thaliana]
MAQEDVTAVATNGAGPVETHLVFTEFKQMLLVEAQKVGDAVTFYKSAFGAIESGHSLYPKRKLDQELPHVLSSELNLAGSSFVVCDVSSLPGFSTAKSEGSGVTFLLGTKDAEAAVAKAVDAGAVKVEVTEAEVELGFKGKVTDPFGVTWIFAEKKTVITVENDENKEV